MKKKRLTIIIIAVITAITGLVLSFSALFLMGFDFSRLNIEFIPSNGKIIFSQKLETKTFNIDKIFSSISINTDTSDVALVPYDGQNCRVEMTTAENTECSALAENGILTVREKRRFKFSFSFSVFSEKECVTVYLPYSDLEALDISTDTGDINIPKDFSFKTVKIESDTGDINCNSKTEGDITVETHTGDMKFNGINGAEGIKLLSDTGDINIDSCVFGSINIETDTGNVELNSCDADEINITTDTGDVSGSLMSEKIFFTESDTGDIDVPKTMSGGKCSITTDTGDIEIKIKNHGE